MYATPTNPQKWKESSRRKCSWLSYHSPHLLHFPDAKRHKSYDETLFSPAVYLSHRYCACGPAHVKGPARRQATGKDEPLSLRCAHIERNTLPTLRSTPRGKAPSGERTHQMNYIP